LNTSRHTLGKQLAYDIKRGILDGWYRFLFVLIVFFVLFAFIDRNIQTVLVHAEGVAVPTLGDYLTDFHKGMEIYIPGLDEPFVVPAGWLLYYALLAFIIGNYPFKDMARYGQQVLLRCKKRSTWWYGKCFWVVLTALVYHLLALLVAGWFAYRRGSLSLVPTKEIGLALSQYDTAAFTGADVLRNAVVLPLTMSVALCLAQTVVSMVTRPFWGLVSVIVVLVVSAFYFSPIMPGNYLMLVRNAAYYPAVGISFYNGMCFAAVIIFASVSFGKLIFDRYNIL
jgi:hypothetical protein